jgi:hypothetical protein
MRKRIAAALAVGAVGVGLALPAGAVAWTAPNGDKCTDHDGGACSSSAPGVPPGHSNNPNPGK